MSFSSESALPSFWPQALRKRPAGEQLEKGGKTSFSWMDSSASPRLSFGFHRGQALKGPDFKSVASGPRGEELGL